ERCVAPLGVDYAGHLTAARVDAALEEWDRPRRAAPERLAELVTHPAVEDADLRERYGHWRFQWQQEYDLLASGQLRSLFQKHSVSPAGGA
ncbi:MAG TPA: hypothetical protein VFD73_20035, partial [Gemmatimonadales bacterium]|nr:hypothetical protein [Gemmatimonadales bacterium]